MNRLYTHTNIHITIYVLHQIITRCHLFLDFYVDDYGVDSVQTNQIMTLACIIVKLQPEQFNKSIKRNKLQNYILL